MDSEWRVELLEETLSISGPGPVTIAVPNFDCWRTWTIHDRDGSEGTAYPLWPARAHIGDIEAEALSLRVFQAGALHQEEQAPGPEHGNAETRAPGGALLKLGRWITWPVPREFAEGLVAVLQGRPPVD